MPPDGTLEEKFALRHEVTVSDEGPFKKLFGKNRVLTNTLHGQGIMKPGKRVIIDGYAHDGTPKHYTLLMLQVHTFRSVAP